MDGIVVYIETGKMEEQKKHIEEPEASLLLSYIKDSASAEECSIVESWLHDKEENEQTLLQIARIYHAQYTYRRIEQRDSFKAFELIQIRLKKKKNRLYLFRFMKYASIIILMIMTSAVTSLFTEKKELPHDIPQMVTMCSSAGMRTQLTLPDGTIVFLNSRTTISYPVRFDPDVRKVVLDGEAYFKVSHNPDYPFIVCLNDNKMQLEVLGTEFNVESYRTDDVIHTSLVNGSVKIHVQLSADSKIERVLKPSEKAVFEKNSQKFTVQRVNTAYDTVWMDGVLMFKETSLPEVLRRLSHFYDVSFEVKDPVINSYCFTGTFVNRQLSQVLDYLQISSDISYNIIRTVEDDSHGIKRDKVILRKK
jgi:hypothetical protein